MKTENGRNFHQKCCKNCNSHFKIRIFQEYMHDNIGCIKLKLQFENLVDSYTYRLNLDQNICMYPCLFDAWLFNANAIFFSLSETVTLWEEGKKV